MKKKKFVKLMCEWEDVPKKNKKVAKALLCKK